MQQQQQIDSVKEDNKKALCEVKMNEEVFYKISDVHKMRPFFMSIVSDSNHWLFVASNGAISAGRKNSEYALFPYYTDDKITESAELTGSKTIIWVTINGEEKVWEPFSIRSEALFAVQRNVYKNRYGNKIIFEEINTELALTFRYEWNSSNKYGFVRKATIINQSSGKVSVNLLDGMQNLLPYGVGADLQNSTSNLADAYKRSELLPESGLGIFALSAIIVDKAEPSEALKANTVWSAGLNNPLYLLSSLQLNNFRRGGAIHQDEDIKGEKGAYFIHSEISLAPGEERHWLMVANVNQSQASVVHLDNEIKNSISNIYNDVLEDVEAGTKHLLALAAAADSIQYTSDDLLNTRHFSNVLFNIMRGGIFDDNYSIWESDFAKYLQKANHVVGHESELYVKALPADFSVFALKETAGKSGNADFVRLATEYLPLKFSRRHGDPSRPWNKFTINTRSEIDGSKILDYEGNWRDIFQNWEALAHSYPAFIEGMIFKFLNASTFDGYNPYRVTKDGFDWESIEPDNPWSYIGYWGDHQVVYLLKFLEFAQNHYPQLLTDIFDKDYFVYANVPYKIKPYQEILKNPKDTIEFNHHAELSIHKRMKQHGADGALLTNSSDTIHHVSFAEKILATLLAKITNLVPEGGIWMNTQRPEWNDANNALVGNGLSMVTLYYLRRFLNFLNTLLDANTKTEFAVSEEMSGYFIAVASVFEKYAACLPGDLGNDQKKKMLDELGEASSSYRTQIYDSCFTGKKSAVTNSHLKQFVHTALRFMDLSIQANRRKDGLYHTYNLLSYDDTAIKISHLSEMLEGQVGVLSSGFLSAEESLNLLDALRNSALYRPDQNSYLLYPNKELPSFLQKNKVPAQAVQSVALLQQMVENNDATIVQQDVKGDFHFNGNFRNAGDLKLALQHLATAYQPLAKQDELAVLNLFEQVFNHKSFTGRSGTFFAYEGLGSIYWHMVSKLLLAVQETCLRAVQQNAGLDIVSGLCQHYDAIFKGIGVHKSPALYGAFPTDPYSHTPFGKGVQQPGMTGQVKEDIISRLGELGVLAKNGKLAFEPVLLKRQEFLKAGKIVEFIQLNGEPQKVALPNDSLMFTYCQIPVIYHLRNEKGLQIEFQDGTKVEMKTLELTPEQTGEIFRRSGDIQTITAFIEEGMLRK